MGYSNTYQRINSETVRVIDPKHEASHPGRPCATINREAIALYNQMASEVQLRSERLHFTDQIRPGKDVFEDFFDLRDLAVEELAAAIAMAGDGAMNAAYGRSTAQPLPSYPIYLPTSKPQDKPWPFGREATLAMIGFLNQLMCSSAVRDMTHGVSGKCCQNALRPLMVWIDQQSRRWLGQRFTAEEKSEQKVLEYFVNVGQGDAAEMPSILLWRPEDEHYRTLNMRVETTHPEGHITVEAEGERQPKPQPQTDEGNGDGATIGPHTD